MTTIDMIFLHNINVGDTVFTVIVILLIVLFFISLAMFIKSRLTKQKTNIDQNARIEQKLDKIIELLEKK